MKGEGQRQINKIVEPEDVDADKLDSCETRAQKLFYLMQLGEKEHKDYSKDLINKTTFKNFILSIDSDMKVDKIQKLFEYIIRKHKSHAVIKVSDFDEWLEDVWGSWVAKLHKRILLYLKSAIYKAHQES
eukprot:UN30629